MSTTKKCVNVLILSLLVIFVGAWDQDCDPKPAVSSSGVSKTSVTIPVGSDGFTSEQRNIRDRYMEDNKPGAIKHLYVISPYSGQVILYSTVRAKVTSGGKRLTPTHVVVGSSGEYKREGFDASIGGNSFATDEVLQDDGTYGVSGDYLFWWDIRGAYNQIYVNNSAVIVVSSQPLPVKSVTINIEQRSAGEPK